MFRDGPLQRGAISAGSVPATGSRHSASRARWKRGEAAHDGAAQHRRHTILESGAATIHSNTHPRVNSDLRKMFRAVLAGLLLACVAAPAGAQRVIEAVRLGEDERIRLDGVLDEPIWQRIQPASDFLQQEPQEGGEPSERTEVRIAYSRDNLYLGVTLFDSNPRGILAHQRQRDAGLGTDDRFMWILDTFRDGRTGYFFEINPAGLRGDGLLRRGGGVNKSWDGIWDVRVTRDEHGWTAEIRMPFRTLNFDPAASSWGINFQRTVRRKSEEILWSGHRRNQGLFQPVHAGLLTGLEGISQGMGLEVKPYVSVAARAATERGVSEWESPATTGFDLSYSLTPGLRASLSVNTDFAEAEVDQRRVNLTRFPLRFPEQRDFFLEGSGVFVFAPDNGVEPYFSRRIGLVSGTPVPIRYGTRLTGQAGAYDLGFVQVRTGVEEGLPAENFTVARVVRNLFQQSSVGMIYTRRSTGEEEDAPLLPDRHTLGTDLNLSTSRFLGDRNLRFQAFYVWHSDPTPEGGATWSQRTARGIRLSYPNDLWSGHISYRELGESFDPPVGFTPRRGFRRVQPSLQYSPRPEWWPQVRQLDFGISGEYLADLSGQLQTGSIGLDVLGIRFESGDQISLEYDTSFERLEREFRLHPDTARRTLIPAGDYSFGGWEINASTAGRRPVSAGFAFSRGAFWSGRRNQLGASVTVRPLAGVNLSAGAEQNAVRLPEEEFTTRLMRVGAGWHLNPATSLTGNLQYDNVSEVAGLYTRLRWIIRPGSDLFVVYTHNWQNVIGGFDTLQRGATTKLSYTHRF